MSVELITLLMFGFMLVMLASGLPVAFVLGGSAVLFGLVFWGPASFYVILLKASDLMRASVLVAVPLFVFMAFVLERSGIAERLYQAVLVWCGGLPGGLAVATVIGCTMVAAMSGISTTGVLMMGIIGFPAMMRRRYDERMAMGSIMAGGALGSLIPPSIVFIVYALLADLSVGKLFLGGVLPGLLLSGLFLAYVIVRCWLKPELGPPLPQAERADLMGKLVALRGVVLPVLIVGGVLGSMFAGIATPTEAAAVGAFGSIVSAAVHGQLNWPMLRDAAYRTLSVVAMVMWIVFGATVFASIYQGLGASSMVQGLLTGWQVNPWVVLVVMQLIWIVLGCLMDALSILMITGPIFIPVAAALGFDPLWFGVLYAVNTEMGYLTPPFGVNLFVMRGIVPKDQIGMSNIYRAALPFVLLQAIGLVVVMAMPEIATWLPNLLLR